MSDMFLGQIMQVGFNFAPQNWYTCQGQLLPISQNTALFSLLGTFFGGNGVSTFALPDFQGRVPIGTGQGQGLSPYVIGEMAGAETTVLTQSNMPAHTHLAQFQASGVSVTMNASTSAATAATPAAGSQLAQSVDPSGNATPQIYVPAGTGTSVALSGLGLSIGSGAVTNAATGGSLPFPSLPPYLAITTIIAYNGIYPSRS